MQPRVVIDPVRGPYFVQGHPTFRVGLVVAQNAPAATVRVQFPDRDNIASYWLPVIVPKSQEDKFYWLPDIGEQVVVLMDEHDESGAVVGAIYSAPDPPPGGMNPDKFHVTFKDGTVVEYDRVQHMLLVSLGTGGSALVATPAGNQVKLDTVGNVNVTAGNGGKVAFAQAGGQASDGLALVSKLVNAFNAHVHRDPQGGETGVPIVQWGPETVASTLLGVSE